MPTYKQIQDRVRAQTGRTPKNCWIAHVKDDEGLTTSNRAKSHKPK